MASISRKDAHSSELVLDVVDCMKGLLLINLGTPASPDITGVRIYLKEFLSDPRVINLPAPLRYILLHVFILPFRSKSSSKAYQAIWTPEGSPLLINSQRLLGKVQTYLGPEYKVALGMRYGHPSIQTALDTLMDCEHLTVLPLYPQYSSAATGSAIEQFLALMAKKTHPPTLQIIRDFYSHPQFLAAQADLIKPYISSHEFLLFSYHGLPENHLKPGCPTPCSDSTQCLKSQKNTCYRQQCFSTTEAVARELKLASHQYASTFQSRLGKTEWIKPYTEEMLHHLAKKGLKRLAVVCPSFVADCLETLEEIGIRAREQWIKLGGEELTLIPCLNDSAGWVSCLSTIVTQDNRVPRLASGAFKP